MTDPTDSSTPNPVAAGLAGNVARLRRARQLSLDALARRSGVSKGMLVAIEGGGANPSIGTLCRVAMALGASVAELVEVGDAAPVRLVPPAEAARLWTGPAGGSGVLLAGTPGPGMLELWLWQMHPGERYAGDPHPAGTEELLHVLAGALALEVEGARHLIPGGSSVAARTDRPHAYECAGAEPVRFVMVVSEPGSR